MALGPSRATLRHRAGPLTLPGVGAFLLRVVSICCGMGFRDDPLFLTLPGVGRVRCSPHAFDRMEERDISKDYLSTMILKHRHKWDAGVRMTQGGDTVVVKLDDVTVVLAGFDGEANLVTVYRESASGKGRKAR